MIERSIEVPRIVVLPKGEVVRGYEPFELDLAGVRYAKVSAELLARHLRTGQVDRIAAGEGGLSELREEDHVVRRLIDFDDVDYAKHSDLLYELASQVVKHLRGYLSEDDAREVLRCYEKPIADLVHSQMQAHAVEHAGQYEAQVTSGFRQLTPQASEVVAKRDAAVTWCRHASQHAARHGRKSWRYLLIPHDVIAENMTLLGLAERFG